MKISLSLLTLADKSHTTLTINQILTQKWFFTSEHKCFIIESYFHNDVFYYREWTYRTVACLAEFQQKFPNFAMLEADFLNVLRNIVKSVS
jgi:hypothetical protein